MSAAVGPAPILPSLVSLVPASAQLMGSARFAKILHSRPRLRTLSLLVLVSLSTLRAQPQANALADPVNSALNWLLAHQQSDGSYGFLTELQTAPAANALWIRFGNSSSILSSYNWLKNQMQNSTTWFWSSSFGEADVPGEVLYSFAATQHLQILSVSTVSSRLLGFQQPNGGFKGYNPSGQQVTSSVDTAMALWGLTNAGTISSTNRQSAINYLFSLQNGDGSFNLTRTVVSDPLYSLGPEPLSITALVSLVLKDASFTTSDPHVSSALSLLSSAASRNFNGHVYAAALSALAFKAFSRPADATKAIAFILSQQNPDGGFRDTSRSSTGSNALDTGWAATALQLVPRDVSVTAIQIPQFIYRGQTISVKVNVTNRGQTTETFNLTLRYNGTTIATVSVPALPPATTRTVSVTWNTMGQVPGGCLLSAEIPALPGETNITDNSLSGSYSYSSCIRKTGDTDGDRDVDLDDLIATYLHQFTTEPTTIPRYDIDGDGAVDIDDLILVYVNQYT